MKRILLLSLAALSVSGARAADLPVRAAPVPPPPLPYNWTGAYLGVHGGFVDSDTKFQDVTISATTGQPIAYNAGGRVPFRGDKPGAFGGGQIGYNYQYGSFGALPLVGSFFGGFKAVPVVGVEADFGYMQVGQHHIDPASSAFAFDSSGINRSGFYATATGRLGFAVNRVLVYAKGGAAFLDSQTQYLDATPNPVTLSAVNRNWRYGYTAGAGIEYAFRDNLTLKGEFLYYDFDRVNMSGRPVAGGVPFGQFYTFRDRLDAYSAKVGLNYKFGAY